MFRFFKYKIIGLSFFFTTISLIILVWAINVPAIVNDDFIIVLDQSGSMREQVPGKPGKYVNDPLLAKKSSGALAAIDFVVKDLLRVGDYFVLITFGDKPKLILSQQIRYEHERELLKGRTYQLTFRDKHTDILAGIREATDILSSLQTSQRRKIMVMITDGINEPPKDSPFANPELYPTLIIFVFGKFFFTKLTDLSIEPLSTKKTSKLLYD